MKSEVENLVLSSLSASEFDGIKQHLEKLKVPVGKVLHYPAEKIDYIYFPETCVISIVNVLENGETVESGIIGSEGFSGAAMILSESLSPQEVTIQLTGELFRLPVSVFNKLFDKNKGFRDSALRYIYAFIAQISQNAACLCHHHTVQRLARWLLMFDDRSTDQELVLTQEFIAQMLGVHRPTVSKNANDLQKRGFIYYNRGTVRILDRAGLEKLACECYEFIKKTIKNDSGKRIFEKASIK